MSNDTIQTARDIIALARLVALLAIGGIMSHGFARQHEQAAVYYERLTQCTRDNNSIRSEMYELHAHISKLKEQLDAEQ